MDQPSVGRVMLVYGVLALFIVAALWFPRSWWARLLWSRHGPNTGPETTTRAETLRSAAGFVGIAAMAATTILLAVIAGHWLYGGFDRSPTLSAIFFMATLGFLVGMVGAGYLALRALRRPATMYRWHEDPLSQCRYLKEYRSADERKRVVIVQHPSRVFEVVEITPLPPDARVGLTPRALPSGLLRTVLQTDSLEAAEAAARVATGNQATVGREEGA